MENIRVERVEPQDRQANYDKGIKHMKMTCDQTTDKNYPLHADYPKNLMLEVTNACNLRCVMCDNRNMKRTRGLMSLDTFKRALENAKEIGIEMVGLYTTGEPLLHPQIFDFIKIAKSMGFRYVYMTTNGMLLNKEASEKILESGLDSIKFSIDASNKETYETLRPGGKFETLLENIRTLRRLRDEKKSSLKIYSSFVMTNKNYKELKHFKEFWKDLIDEIIVYIVTNQAGHQKTEFESLVPESLKKILEQKNQCCNRLWNRIIVTHDGKFTICPEDFEAALTYGDIREESMRDAWNNEKMKNFRSMFKTRDFSLSPNCENCNTYLTDSLIVDDYEKIFEDGKK